jgi:hypothetical protein
LASPTSNTDRLIDRLVAEASPVRRLIDPRRRAALWTALALACVAAGAAWFGVRGDLAREMTVLPYVARVTLLAATMWLAVVAALRLAVPGADPRAWTRWWPLALLGAATAAVVVEAVIAAVWGDGAGAPSYHWQCVRKIAIVGTVPAIAAMALIRRAVSLDPVWTVVLGLVAAGAAAALAAEITCPVRLPMHVMLWHVLPIAAVAAIGGGLVWLVVRLRSR